MFGQDRAVFGIAQGQNHCSVAIHQRVIHDRNVDDFVRLGRPEGQRAGHRLVILACFGGADGGCGVIDRESHVGVAAPAHDDVRAPAVFAHFTSGKSELHAAVGIENSEDCRLLRAQVHDVWVAQSQVHGFSTFGDGVFEDRNREGGVGLTKTEVECSMLCQVVQSRRGCSVARRVIDLGSRVGRRARDGDYRGTRKLIHRVIGRTELHERFAVRDYDIGVSRVAPPVGLLRIKLKPSSPSGRLSARIGMDIVWIVSPGTKLIVPD